MKCEICAEEIESEEDFAFMDEYTVHKECLANKQAEASFE